MRPVPSWQLHNSKTFAVAHTGSGVGRSVARYVNNALMVRNLGFYNGKQEERVLSLTLPDATDSILILGNDKKSGVLSSIFHSRSLRDE